MNVNRVNRCKQLSQVIAVRLTAQEKQRLQETLSNFHIDEGCLSDDLRALFRKIHAISLRHKVARDMEIRERERQRERERAASCSVTPERDPEAFTDDEEERAYQEWISGLGSEDQ